jgi:hypothetical protein
MVVQRPVAPWRETLEEVHRDAIKQGLAERDKYEPERVYLDAPVWVEME